MKNGKPKGKTPSLIGLANGRPVRVSVKRKSECYRCGADIEINHDCFGIPKIIAGFTTLKRYCKLCFQNILDQTRKDLEEVSNL